MENIENVGRRNEGGKDKKREEEREKEENIEYVRRKNGN